MKIWEIIDTVKLSDEKNGYMWKYGWRVNV